MIEDSIFQALSLQESIILIESDDYLSQALTNLTINLKNTAFTQITWSQADVGTETAGIITALTSNISREGDDNFTINVLNCTFRNLSGNAAVLYNGVESQYDSVMLLNGSVFESISIGGEGAGAIISTTAGTFEVNTSAVTTQAERNATFSIRNNSFQMINASQGAILQWKSQTRGVSLVFEDSNFTEIYSSLNGGVVYLEYLPGWVNDTSSHQYSADDLVIVTVGNCKFSKIGSLGGGFMCGAGYKQFYNFSIRESSFEEIRADQNGAILFLSASPALSAANARLLEGDVLRSLTATGQVGGIFLIHSTDFSSITALNGGILYESTPNTSISVNITSCVFQDITVTGRGGILYLKQPILSVVNNVFSNITAGFSGSILFSNCDQINLTNFTTLNTYDGASEGTYMFGFASTNLKVEFILKADGSELPLENYQNLSTNPIVPNLTSHSLSLYQIKLTLAYYGSQDYQIVLDESITAGVQLAFTLPGKPTPKTNYYSCQHSTCTISSDETLTGLAGDMILVNASYSSNLFQQFQQFQIRLRECIAGEINNTALQQCDYCIQGTYSLSPGDLECQPCPSGSFCNGGANITVLPGFYRSANSSRLIILPCNDSNERCLGGIGNTVCSPVYTGPLCYQCNTEEGYLSSKAGVCSYCYEKGMLIFYAIFLLAFTVCYQLIMIIVTYRENQKRHEEYLETHNLRSLAPGALMVIAASFTQIVSLVADDSVNLISKTMNVFNTVGNPAPAAFFSVQCLYNLIEKNPQNSYNFQILLIIFSPLAKILVILIAEIIWVLIRARKAPNWKEKTITRVGAAATVLILLEQPTIIGVLCSYMSCDQLDPYVQDAYFVKDYNNIQCYTSEYNSFKYKAIVPALLFWGVLVPLVIFLILCKKREKLFKYEKYRIIFGNFYSAYKEETFYWGVIIMNFKMFLYILSAFLPGDSFTKSLIYICLFHTYYVVLKKRPPYENKTLCKAEEYCVTCYLVLILLSYFKSTASASAAVETCNVLSYMALVLTGAYLFVKIFELQLIKVLHVVRSLKTLQRDKKIRKETLWELERYHQANFQLRKGRRTAISLDLPMR